MNLLILQTDLFPDTEGVWAALDAAFAARQERLDLRRPDMEAADWDRVMERILAADRIITL